MGFKGEEAAKILEHLKDAEYKLRNDNSTEFNTVIRKIMAIRRIK
jgi:hypothetical protein